MEGVLSTISNQTLYHHEQYRGVGSKFGLIFCQISKCMQMLGGSGGMSPEKSLKIDALRLNLVVFFDSSVQCTIVHD